MEFRTFAANQMREIEEFINEHNIKKEDIVNIFQNADKSFILNYFQSE